MQECRLPPSAHDPGESLNHCEPVSSTPFPFASWGHDSWKGRKRRSSGRNRRSPAAVEVRAAGLCPTSPAAHPRLPGSPLTQDDNPS